MARTRKDKAVATEQELFARVISVWARDAMFPPARLGALASYVDSFPTIEPDALLGQMRRAPLPYDMSRGNSVWVVGAPIAKGAVHLLPIATVALSAEDDRIVGTIRIALLQESTRFGATVTGWRFESAERPSPSTAAKATGTDAGQPPPHRYPHAQPVSGWHTSTSCLLHPHSAGDDDDGCRPHGVERANQFVLNETRPAFPLRGRTLPGLAAAALTTLYGPDRTRTMLDTDANLAQVADGARVDFIDILGE